MRTEKQKLGQYLTSPIIAEFMAKQVYFEQAQTVLDPAVGEGVFLTCLNRLNNALHFVAYDIDNAMIAKAEAMKTADVEYRNEDYLLSDVKIQPDIIICNPPYNRFQEIPNRNEYRRLFKNKYRFEISGYSNLCVYFLVKSLHELADNGKCVFVIPYEFLNTGYGTAIKELIIESKFLKTIYKFDSNMSIFDDALTTSCILVFEKKVHEHIDFVLIRDICEVETSQFRNKQIHRYDELDIKAKWNLYFVPKDKKRYRNLVDFLHIAKVKRGIATGGNAFFALTKQQADDLELSEDVLVKCVCKAPDIRKAIFRDEEFVELSSANRKVYLFDGRRARNQNDFAYIKYGESKGYDKSYLNSHRTPWYSLEDKNVAPIWISVFSRKRLKIVRNETQAKNLTTFHGVYFRKDFNRDYINIFFCYLLTSVCQNILANCKREYGAGLNKFEPNDLNYAKVLDISVISDNDKNKILELYEQMKIDERKIEEIVEELNTIFVSYIF